MDNNNLNQPMGSKQQNYETILKDLETVNPLEDKAFRILLADAGVFGLEAHMITGDRVMPNSLYVFNNTVVLTVDGKGVVMDTVFESDGSINRAIRIACSRYKLDENKMKGDAKMVSLYTSFITDEERESAISMGRIEGKIELLHKDFNYSVESIANLLNLSAYEVSNIICKLK